MDQLKEIGQQLVKYRFWVLSVVVLIVSILAYRSGAKMLSEKYATRERAVSDAFTKMRTVAGTADHPNETFLTEINKLHDEEKQLTLAAWESLYERQSEVLRWPDQFRSIGRLPLDAEIDRNDRYAYMNYARDQLDRLYDIVQVREKRSIEGEDGEQEQVETGLVVWEESSRDQLERLFKFSGEPTTKRVRYTQETLWVYEALLGIIAEVNEGATAFYNAPIREIVELQIAQAAVRPMQSDVELPTTSGPGAGPAASNSVETTVPGPESTDEELGQGRYVDDQGQPIPATQADTAEFKLMPVQMKLVIDQREIPSLLASCANAELVVEVRRVRINPDAGGDSGRPAGGAGNRGGDNKNLANPYNVTIALYGLIYIYNPPDKQKLGIMDAVAGGPPGAPATPPTPGT